MSTSYWRRFPCPLRLLFGLPLLLAQWPRLFVDWPRLPPPPGLVGAPRDESFVRWGFWIVPWRIPWRLGAEEVDEDEMPKSRRIRTYSGKERQTRYDCYCLL